MMSAEHTATGDEVRNFRATVEYDGTGYHGFQIQVGRPTIQGALEKALFQVTRGFVRVQGAGRTDAGVHARGQVITFKTEWHHSCCDLERALNALIDRDIAVRQVVCVDSRFHARFSACRRVYVYRLFWSKTRSPLRERFALRTPARLDVDAMQSAAALLLGEHDFAAFGQAPSGENTVRCVLAAQWRPARSESPHVGGEQSFQEGDLWEFEIAANAFLRGMVRRIVGTLISVGSGHLSVTEFAKILGSRDIGRASAPVSPNGLFLWRVEYRDEHERNERALGHY